MFLSNLEIILYAPLFTGRLAFFTYNDFVLVVDAVAVIRFNLLDGFDSCRALTDFDFVDAFDGDFDKVRGGVDNGRGLRHLG